MNRTLLFFLLMLLAGSGVQAQWSALRSAGKAASAASAASVGRNMIRQLERQSQTFRVAVALRSTYAGWRTARQAEQLSRLNRKSVCKSSNFFSELMQEAIQSTQESQWNLPDSIPADFLKTPAVPTEIGTLKFRSNAKMRQSKPHDTDCDSVLETIKQVPGLK